MTDSSKRRRSSASAGRPLRVAPGDALAAQAVQVLLGGDPVGHREAGQLDVAQRELQGRAAPGDLQRDRQRVEEAGQGLGHLGAGLEVELLRLELEAVRVAQQVARLDGQERLVGVGVLAAGVVGVAGGHHRQPGVARQPAQVLVDAGLHLQAGVLDLHVDVVAAEDLGEGVELGAGRPEVVALEAGAHHARQAPGERDEAVGVALHELVRDARLAVVALEVAGRAELDEVVVALGRLGEERQVVAPLAGGALAVVGDHVGLEAHDRRDAALGRLAVQLDGAAHDPVVGERDGALADLLDPVEEPLDLARPVQDRVVGVDVEVREGRVGGGRHRGGQARIRARRAARNDHAWCGLFRRTLPRWMVEATSSGYRVESDVPRPRPGLDQPQQRVSLPRHGGPLGRP